MTPGRTALASPRARGSCHRDSRHRPRVRVRLIMASVMIMSTPKFFGLPDTPLAHYFCIACRWITEQPTHLTIWLLRRWREVEPLPFCFHCPRMFMVVFFPRKFFVFARCGGYKKSSGFYSCRPPHCPIDASSLIFLAAPEAYKRGRVSDGYITLKFNKMHFNCSRHN